jgi:formamidopyrimidine-DNA glycosylase
LPELPEIESIRRALERSIVGQRIESAVLGPHDLRARGAGRARITPRHGKAWATPQELLVGGRVASLERRGKQLGIVVDDGRALVVQLGMSGQLLVMHEAPATHRHVTWSLSGPGAEVLVFRDPRRFGGIVPHGRVQAMLDRWERELGPDGLDTARAPIERLRRGARHVKAALLDQSLVAGIGNIYADEALHAAGIRPSRRCNRLTHEESARVLEEARRIMRRSVSQGGTSLRDHVLPQGDPGAARRLIQAYGRTGLPCHGCGLPLKGGRIAGRATTWCTKCQR